VVFLKGRGKINGATTELQPDFGVVTKPPNIKNTPPLKLSPGQETAAETPYQKPPPHTTKTTPTKPLLKQRTKTKPLQKGKTKSHPPPQKPPHLTEPPLQHHCI
jgi:hypothetical protein